MKFIALSSLAAAAISAASAGSIPYYNTTFTNTTSPFNSTGSGIFNTTQAACIVLVPEPSTVVNVTTFSSNAPFSLNATLTLSSNFPNATFSANATNATFTLSFSSSFPNATATSNSSHSHLVPRASFSGSGFPNATAFSSIGFPNATAFSSSGFPNATFSSSSSFPNATSFSASGGVPNATFTSSGGLPNATITTAPTATITGTIANPSPNEVSTVFAPSISAMFNVSTLPLCNPLNPFVSAAAPQNTSTGSAQVNIGKSGASALTTSVGAVVLSMVAGIFVGF